jgi:hypothetical protein
MRTTKFKKYPNGKSLAVFFSLALLGGLSGCEKTDFQPGPEVARAAKSVETPQVAGLSSEGAGREKPSKGIVKLVRQDSGWQLLRDGQPYYVNGAGGEGSLEMLAKAGANSNRTWGVDDTQETLARLDEAEKNGLTVALGIWLEHERHGMDYTDYAKVTKQIDQTLKHVRDLKHHPAILVWGIGNEMEGDGSNPAIWSHIEHLAQLVKREDPYHPVMTVIAELGGKKIEAIHKLCPSVDIIGINSYGGARSLPERYKRLGGQKPYIVTEYGPVGTWEVPKNSIDAIAEPTSTKKAMTYRTNAEAFAKDKEYCLGSYAFLWGNKQEGTATWFGMLLPDGKRTAAVDQMTELWTGKKPDNLCPEILSLKYDGKATRKKNELLSVKLEAKDPEGDALNVRWIVTGEADSYSTGGDKQAAPEEIKGAVVEGSLEGAKVKLPTESGIYRIYAYVDDGENGGAATANVSVRVEGDPKPLAQPGGKVTLPLVILDEPSSAAAEAGLPFYVPSGFMGSTDALKVEPDCKQDPKFGQHCTKVTYNKSNDWGGVVWQHPENDWGKMPGGFDLTGATKLTFWAKGDKGGEEVKFGVGVIGRDQPFFDTVKVEVPKTLGKEWKQYTIDLTDRDLQRVKSGFFFSLSGQGDLVEFYLDRIVFE